jgi:TonB family protein
VSRGLGGALALSALIHGGVVAALGSAVLDGPGRLPRLTGIRVDLVDLGGIVGAAPGGERHAPRSDRPTGSPSRRSMAGSPFPAARARPAEGADGHPAAAMTGRAPEGPEAGIGPGAWAPVATPVPPAPPPAPARPTVETAIGAVPDADIVAPRSSPMATRRERDATLSAGPEAAALSRRRLAARTDAEPPATPSPPMAMNGDAGSSPARGEPSSRPEAPGAATGTESGPARASGRRDLVDGQLTGRPAGEVVAEPESAVSGAGVGAPARDGRDGTAVARASGDTGTIPPEYDGYLRALRERVQARLVYPWTAIRRGQQGTVELEVHLGPEGRLAGVRVVSGPATAGLGAAAIQAVQEAAPFPFPNGLTGRSLVVRLPVVFRLR